MKSYVLTIFILSAVSTYAQSASTQTTFTSKTDTGMDQFGNQTYQQSVTIKTNNYQVETFWSRFFNPNDKQKEFTNISTVAQAKLVAEASSGCSIAGRGVLAAEGCSGQKPFLINNEAVPASNGDKISLIFQPAYDDKTGTKMFNASNKNVFYPMDIGRNQEHYKEEASAPSGSKKSFFSFFTGIFDFFFSQTIGFGNDFFGESDISDVQYSGRSDDAKDRRQRYLSNMIAGVDQDHRMKKPYNNEAGTSLSSSLNTPVSLLHYAESKKTTEQDQCKFMFMKLSSDGVMCRMMSGFGMNAWMPFFTSAKISKAEVNTITIDTENSLLALVGQVGGDTYQDVGGTDQQKLSLLQQMIKPMSTMMEMMKSMMFGTSKKDIVANPVEISHSLGDKELTLTMAVTNDGSRVDNFAHFRLLGIRSVMGDEVDSCSVKKSAGIFSAGMFSSEWEETFDSDKSSTITSKKYGSIDTHGEWINWCQEANNKKGMFDYLTDWSSGAMFNPFNWMKGMWSAMKNFMFGSYSITNFKSTLKRGLILDLEKTGVDTKDPLTTTNIRLMKITH